MYGFNDYNDKECEYDNRPACYVPWLLSSVPAAAIAGVELNAPFGFLKCHDQYQYDHDRCHGDPDDDAVSMEG